MHWEDRFRTVANQQEGLVARFHLAALGCTAQHWWRAKHNGRWDVVSPRVLKLAGAPESEAQRVLAAVLDASPGAVLHGRSALAWFGLGGFDLRTIQVARPNGMSSTPPHLSRFHRLRDLRPHDVVVVRGVPTETALRAIWIEAARYASERWQDIGYLKIGRLLDEAHRRDLVTWAALHEMVDDIHERGRAGTVIMRALAEARPPGSSPTESRLEDRFEEVLTRHGQPPLKRQVVAGGHEPIGRADFRDPALPLVVEVNSVTFHTTPTDREADAIRYQRFNDAGFTVAVMWEDDLWRHPVDVAKTIADARKRAQNQEPVVVHSQSRPWPS